MVQPLANGSEQPSFNETTNGTNGVSSSASSTSTDSTMSNPPDLSLIATGARVVEEVERILESRGLGATHEDQAKANPVAGSERSPSPEQYSPERSPSPQHSPPRDTVRTQEELSRINAPLGSTSCSGHLMEHCTPREVLRRFESTRTFVLEVQTAQAGGWISLQSDRYGLD